MSKTSDPVGILLLLYMAFTLAAWLGVNNSAINPVAGNVTVTNQYASAYNNTNWILWLSAPLGLYMIVDTGFDISNKRKQREEENQPNESAGLSNV